MSVEYCGNDFCGSMKKKLDAACHELGKEAGKWIMYNPIDKPLCYCICSCLGESTLVTDADGGEILIQDIVEGVTAVKAAGKDLHFSSRVVESLVATVAGETKNSIYIRYKIGGVEVNRVVTMDHPFLLANGSLVGAGMLQLADELMDESGNSVPIDDLRWGSYIGQFWSLATDLNEPDANLDGHLLLTDGVVTGDYAVTIYVNYPVSSDQVLSKSMEDRPFIGSREWSEKNGYNAGHSEDGPIEMEDGIFVPAECYHRDIPEHASAFLPDNQAIWLELTAPKEPISNANLLDMCEFLIQYVFEPHYPDIDFTFDWYDNTVNSFSWVDTRTEKMHVYLSGGLARIKGFEMDGVTMALAHEVGHLLGKPRLENGTTCEGQADWYGGSIVLRKLWFGEEYFTKLESAIEQLKQLYQYMKLRSEDHDEDPRPPKHDGEGQPYPSNKCRIRTYTDAMASPIPPPCSLCDVEEGDEDDELDIVDGEDLFDDEYDDDEYEACDGYDDDDDDDAPIPPKDTGGSDRQRRKPMRNDDSVLAKVSGARDRQRRKSRRFDDDDHSALAKVSGARDRQRRKKRRLEDDDHSTLAKVSGARDRQRRKKRRLEDDDHSALAKVSGARDRQRRKKRSFEDDEDTFAKIPGARDRQRKKKNRLEDDDCTLAKVSGARDRQRKKKYRMEEDSNAGLLAKMSGARDRQRKKKRSLDPVAEGILAKTTGARDRQRKKKRTAEDMPQSLLGKRSGARDRQRKKKS